MKWPKEWSFRKGVEYGLAVIVGVSMATLFMILALNIYVWLKMP